MADQEVQRRANGFKDLTGQRFGRWLVKEYGGPARNKSGNVWCSLWMCVCDCGEQRIVPSASLNRTRGPSRSCGCLGREKAGKSSRSHGESHTNLYRLYRGIISRCYYSKPSSPGWKNYRGKGITICDRWRYGENGMTGYECFKIDMAPRPHRADLDRYPDRDGNYEPSNCRWATRSENLKNRDFAERHFCKAGHPLTGDNLWVRNGVKYCRKCKSIYDRVRYLNGKKSDAKKSI